MGKNKNSLSEEHIRKIMYRSGYKINESPRYRPLISDSEEFDSLPDSNYATRDGMPVPQSPSYSSIYEAGEQEDAEMGQEKDMREPSNASEPNVDNNEPPVGTPPPAPKFANEPEMSPEPMNAEPTGGIEGDVDTIQNDIIKHNIEAMKEIHSQLEMLNNTVMSLNSRISELNSDVEEVREPTNVEKLMSKKDVSYPYYFNLNDFWKDNWFNQKRDEAQERGIRELPDGTFVADFDDLPKPSKTDIQKSFNDII